MKCWLGTNLVGIANVDVAGQWRVEESRFGPGTYSFIGRVQDRAGNVSPFSSALTVTVSGNLTAPSVPTLVPQSDLGLSNIDLITSHTTPTFVGISEPNAPIQLLANDTIVGIGPPTQQAAGALRWPTRWPKALIPSRLKQRTRLETLHRLPRFDSDN